LPLPLNVKAAVAVAVDAAVLVGATVDVKAGVFVALSVGAVVAAKGFEVSAVASGAGVFASGEVPGVAPGAAVNQPFGARDGETCGVLHAASPNKMQTLINKILLIIFVLS